MKPKHDHLADREEYMAIRLKRVLLVHGLTQPAWAAAMRQSDGTPMSRSGASLLINWGRWPRRTPAEWIKKQTADWLTAQGVPVEAQADMWEIDADDPLRGMKPAGLHMTRTGAYLAGARAAAPVPTPEFEPMEIAMLSPAAKRHFKLFRDPFQDEIGAADDVYLGDDQRYIAHNIYAFFNGDYRRVAVLHVESGWVPATTRVDELESAVRTVCSRVVTIP